MAIPGCRVAHGDIPLFPGLAHGLLVQAGSSISIIYIFKLFLLGLFFISPI